MLWAHPRTVMLWAHPRTMDLRIYQVSELPEELINTDNWASPLEFPVQYIWGKVPRFVFRTGSLAILLL